MTISQDSFSHCRPTYPVLHKRRVPFAPCVVVPRGFEERAREIDETNRDLSRLVIPKNELLRLTAEAFSSNIHHSSKLEGNTLTLDQVSKITGDSFAGERPTLSGAPEKEIANHLTALLDTRFFASPWTLETAKSLHRVLMAGVEPKANPGEFRSGQMWITSDAGMPTFRACPPESIREELESLLDWLNRMGPGFHPIITASIFFHEFESIHPFEDGNGRTGRVLFHGYLQTHGLDNVNACKLEAELLADPELYYRVLGWTDMVGQYTELIDYVQQALLASYREALRSFREKDIIGAELNETTRRLISRARQSATWFSVKDGCAWVEGVSDQTVRNHLNALVRKGVLESRGLTRSRRYRFSASLRMALEYVRYFGHGELDSDSPPGASPPAGALIERSGEGPQRTLDAATAS
jgi:Fic family protein